MHKFNSQIAAATGARQIVTLDRLNQFAGTVAAGVTGLTATVFRLLRRVPAWEHHSALRSLIHQRYAELYRALFSGLHDLAEAHYTETARMTAKYFPVDKLLIIPTQTGEDTASRLRLIPEGTLSAIRTAKEPAIRNLSRSRRRALFRSEAMPDLTVAEVRRIVLGHDERQGVERIASQTGLARPDQIANRIIGVYAGGGGKRELARALTPILQDNRKAAYRIARTEGARVVNTAAFLAWERLGDLVAGYQIHAKLDQNTRPLHRERNGRIYFKRPTPGKPSVQEMPHPPVEANGEVAPYCRCWLSPVMADVPGDKPALDFANAEGEVIPSPVIYDSWFRDATEGQRRKSVGSERYDVLVSKYPNRKPDYYDFVAVDGSLLDPYYLKREGERRRINRRNTMIRLFSQHRTNKIAVILTGKAPG